ncbi:MAG: universal stress protein [Chitinophagales bacterium]|nr:universal stress protein [Chitinophagales bacterium]MDW8418528.1 universal stress protein [Chitinophagales bacterium]
MDTTQKLRVVIPTDFSVQAEYAYILVHKLEERIPMEIHFLHVLPAPDTVSMDADGKFETCGEIDVKYLETQRDMALDKLKYLQQRYGRHIHTHLRLGKVTDAILTFAKEINAGLIAMGTKGAFGIKEKLSGSETQMVVRKSTIPVLSMMCDRSDLQFRNILLVHDFRQPTRIDLQLMKQLVKSYGCKLHFLQITSGNPDSERAAFEKNASEFARLNGIENFEPHLLKDTDVENGVIHFNQMHDMDVVCIGTHGKGGWLHASATEKLINHLYKPMITFHID